jgi:hypothetical protein
MQATVENYVNSEVFHLLNMHKKNARIYRVIMKFCGFATCKSH